MAGCKWMPLGCVLLLFMHSMCCGRCKMDHVDGRSTRNDHITSAYVTDKLSHWADIRHYLNLLLSTRWLFRILFSGVQNTGYLQCTLSTWIHLNAVLAVELDRITERINWHQQFFAHFCYDNKTTFLNYEFFSGSNKSEPFPYFWVYLFYLEKNTHTHILVFVDSPSFFIVSISI